jgi:hypothetical protein
MRSYLPPGWTLEEHFVNRSGGIHARYRYGSQVQITIRPCIPYEQPGYVEEYLIEHDEGSVKYLAADQRIYLFSAAESIAKEEMWRITLRCPLESASATSS